MLCAGASWVMSTSSIVGFWAGFPFVRVVLLSLSSVTFLVALLRPRPLVIPHVLSVVAFDRPGPRVPFALPPVSSIVALVP